MQLALLAVFAILGAVYANVVPVPSTDYLTNVVSNSQKDEVLDALKERCESLGGADSIDNIKTAVEKFMQCIESGVDKEILGLNDMCDAYNADCVQPIMQAVSVCLKPEEHYLIEFIPKLIDNQFHYICDNNMKHIRDFMSFSNMICFGRIRRDPNSKVCGEILLRKFIENVTGDFLLTKEKVCNTITESQTCNKEMFTESCPNNTAILNTIDDSSVIYAELCFETV